MANRSVLVTGSSGFIGGALHRKFREKGWHVNGLGRRGVDSYDDVVHDLARPLPESLGPFDVVVHAAARSSPWGSRRQFDIDNIQATRHIIAHCRAHGHPRLIFISSSSIYYRPGHQYNMTEADPPAETPINRYAASKIQAEKLVRDYPGQWAILRPRAVFGPGDTVLFPRILSAAKAGRLPLIVSSDQPAVGDLIYIDNLVDIILTAASRNDISGDFNLTNNQPVPIIDFILDIFSRLDIPKPEKQISAGSAMRIAGLLEGLYSLFMPWKEPPITRFGVHVFAFSKTFDVAKMIETFGPPKITIETGIERFIESVRTQNVKDF